MIDSSGQVTTDIQGKVGCICFSHPKANCLTGPVLAQLNSHFRSFAENTNLHAIVLRSEGEGAFCAGASFSEMSELQTESEGREYFLAVASLLKAIRSCPIPVVAVVHGKAVGGGVGIIAACDYVCALSMAMCRLSELEVGLAPFVISGPVQERIGKANFMAMALDAQWRTSDWSFAVGLFQKVFPERQSLEQWLCEWLQCLSKVDREVLIELKTVGHRENTDWIRSLSAHAAMSAKLAIKKNSPRQKK